MIPGVQEIKALALKYSKKQLANMAQTGLIDPQKAVMAGMMRDRIAKEDMQPPSTTVAQDVLGLSPQPQMGMQPQPQPQMAQAQPQPQPQPQMPPPQMGAPMEQPPVMAASGGITSLPVEVQDYAGGGIVAFGDGGDTSSPLGRKLSSVFGGKTYDADTTQELQSLDQQFRALSARDRELSGMFGLQQQTPEQQAEAAQVRQQLDSIFQRSQQLKSGNAPTASPTTFTPVTAPAPDAAPAPVPQAPPPRREAGPRTGRDAGPRAPTLSGPPVLERPKFGAFDPNAIKLKGPTYDMPTIDKLEDITKTREGAEKAAGFNKNLTAEQLARVEGKKGELNALQSRAGGEALMQFGLGLIGAREGEEGQRVSESGRSALSAYKSDIKELRTAKEKLEERAEALRAADNQAKKTDSAADIAERNRQKDKYDTAKLKVFEAENELTKTGALISSQTRGQDMTAATQMYTQELSAKTQKEIAQLNADTQRWVASRPPAEIQAIDIIAKRTGKPFDQAMKDFYGARAGARNMYTREEMMKDARKNLENRGVINPTEAQMQAEIDTLQRTYENRGGGGGGGSLQQGADGSFVYVPRQ
jgi:hypothetical protein